MIIEVLLDNAHELETMINRHQHQFKLVVKRRNTHIYAVVHHDYYHDTYRYESGAVVAIEPISPDPKKRKLADSYSRISDKVEQHLVRHDEVIRNTPLCSYIDLESMDRDNYYELELFDHVLQSIDHLKSFFEMANRLNLTLTTTSLNENIDQDEHTYYFLLEKDIDDTAIKVTLNHKDFSKKSPKNMVNNIELVRIKPNRDEVLRSVSNFTLSRINDDLDTNPEIYMPLFTRSKIFPCDQDMPF